jgi:hypothetical protein
MKMVDDNLGLWQTGLDRWAKGSAHIHAHGFNLLRVSEPFEQRDHILQPTPGTDLKHPCALQITKDGFITMPFPYSKLVYSQVARRRQRALLIHSQASLLQRRSRQALKTVACKPRPNTKRLGNVRDWLNCGLSSNRFTQTQRGSSARATGQIWLCKGGVAHRTTKASFEHNQFHRISSQIQIALDSFTAIMDLVAAVMTVRAYGRVAFGDYGDAQVSIRAPFLRQYAKFGQIQGNNNPFANGYLFCLFFGMLTWQGLFLLTLGYCFLPSSTDNKPLPFSRFCFFLKKTHPSPRRTENRIFHIMTLMWGFALDVDTS